MASFCMGEWVSASRIALARIAHGRQDDFSSLSFFKFDEIDGGDVIPDFNHLADELVRKLNVATTVRVANPEQWLEQVTEAMELRGVLLVFDQIELLLTDAGTWTDPRWAKLSSALDQSPRSGAHYRHLWYLLRNPQNSEVEVWICI